MGRNQHTLRKFGPVVLLAETIEQFGNKVMRKGEMTPEEWSLFDKIAVAGIAGSPHVLDVPGSASIFASHLKRWPRITLDFMLTCRIAGERASPEMKMLTSFEFAAEMIATGRPPADKEFPNLNPKRMQNARRKLAVRESVVEKGIQESESEKVSLKKRRRKGINKIAPKRR